MSDQPLGGAHDGANVTVVSGTAGPSPSRTPVSPGRSWTIGRAADADIVVPDNQVSRRHLVLEHVQDEWLVRDVSSNGSWHNGARIGQDGVRVPRGSEVRLNLGDRAGPQVVIEGPPTASAAATIPAGAAATVTTPAAEAAAPVHPPEPPAPAPGHAPAPVPDAKRHHRYRVIGIVLLVLVVLLAIADRVAARVASTEAVSQIVQQSQGLAKRPSVSFGGFPFLTQVAFGKYSDIHVKISDVTPPGSLRIDSVDAHLKGAHVPFATAIRGNLRTIPVDHVTASVGVRFADLNSFLADQPGQLKLSGRKGAIQINGTVVQDGQTIKVSGAAKLAANADGLVITPTSVHVTTGSDLDDIIGGAGDVLGDALSLFPPVPVPLPDLPFNLRLTSVHSDDNGVVAAAAADHVVLPAN